ncbi:glycerophosphodiester phosphodiesterase [Sphingomonas changnyeongensis]|uniref:glycerophosphodiester phosphodiesterase n=1 Tax=Sphingomonas changnyeongensis TaxID=2698679 RepID=A0A7Z2NTM3_9SPHN|nr:glycerophosphodiester phosphodiesterase [Sphingomonas changnyeongensis]QHL89628.1 glycerophosphodiester phosphodiesterase [Sphingomonas changnyeongensis]
MTASLTPAAAAPVPAASARPVVIAHRGASGERPEHTLAAYERAIEQGADFIEPDLVMTKDGVLVARHENEISGTTDVAERPEFAARRTTRLIDGVEMSGWFTEDFSLAELKTLKARERLPRLRPGNTAFADERIPTFAEVVALARKHGVGVYPETKHPSYFRGIGLPLEAAMLKVLADHGWTRAADPVFIQSFEVENLKMLKGMTALRLVQLVAGAGGPPDRPGTAYADMLTPAGLKEIAGYAAGIGPEKTLVVPRDAAGRSLPPTRLVADAHAAGLVVHPWTFRAENMFLPAELRSGAAGEAHGRLAEELAQFLAAGVDGLFSDYPAAAVTAVRQPR